MLQLTSIGNNYHLYFTENSFDAHKNQLIFLSDRASGRPACRTSDPHYNLFLMDLDTGEIVQLTDEQAVDNRRTEGVSSVTKTPDSSLIVYRSATGCSRPWIPVPVSQRSSTKKPGDYTLGAPSIAANRRYVAFCRNEDVRWPTVPTTPGSRTVSTWSKTVASPSPTWTARAGSTSSRTRTRWATSSFAPTTAPSARYCHEGPWNLVTQRIWLLDFITREARPCFRQAEQDSVGHEFWTRDGCIFFDNRGPGHDGTITS